MGTVNTAQKDFVRINYIEKINIIPNLIDFWQFYPNLLVKYINTTILTLFPVYIDLVFIFNKNKKMLAFSETVNVSLNQKEPK